MTRDTHLARLPQTPSHPEPSEGGQPQREGPGLRAAQAGGQERRQGPRCRGPGSEEHLPAQHRDPGPARTGAPRACLKPEAVSDPPHRQHGSPTQGCVGGPGPQQGSQPEGERPSRERWGARETMLSYLRHGRRGTEGEPPENRVARVKATAAALPFPGPRGCEDRHLSDRKTPGSQPTPGQGRAGERT